MSTVAETPEQIRAYQILVVRKGLQACKIGMRLNRAYTPTRLKRMAENLTGKTFKRGDYDGMAAALGALLPCHCPVADPTAHDRACPRRPI